MGKTKIQKMASGSRNDEEEANDGELVEAAEPRAYSSRRFLPREADKDIFKSCGVGAKLAQVETLTGERGEDARDGGVQFAD